MKKKIGISVILIFEAILLILDIVSLFVSEMLTTPILSTLCGIGKWLFDLGKGLTIVTRLNTLITNESIQSFIGILIITLLFIGIYYLIFGILTIVIRKKQASKRREIVPEYHLTNLEKEQLDESRFIRKKPIKTIISLIIPILIIVFFTLIRFDRVIAQENNMSGSLTIARDYLEPFTNTLFAPIDSHVFFSNVVSIEVNLLKSLGWLEYVVLVLSAAALLVIWFIVFYLIGLMFRGVSAKRRSKYAKARHIEKMEIKEYKLHKKYKDETSVKADDFLSIVEEEQNTPATSISRINTFEEDDNSLNLNDKRRAYIEEIGYGVTDLGITEVQEEVTKPITEREIRYISDEDVDIILEEEPVIEVVEEDDVVEDIVSDDDELFFEKYEVDEESIFEESRGEPQDVEDLIMIQTSKEVEEMVEENIEVNEQKEEIQETPLESSIEENGENDNVTNEVIQDEIIETPVEENIQEEIKEEVNTIDNDTSNEEIQEESNEDISNDEVIENQPSIEENSVQGDNYSQQDKETSTKVEKKEKVDPFKKYRGQIIKDHGTKKVPSFKDLGKEKVSYQKIKKDPFMAYRGGEPKNKGHGAKKVPSFKELEAMKEKEGK